MLNIPHQKPPYQRRGVREVASMAKSQTLEEQAYARGYEQGKFDAEMDRLNITPDTTEIEEVVEEIGNLLQTGEYDKAIAYLHHQLQKAQENTTKEVIEIIESVQLVATKKHKNDTTPEKAKIINDWLMPEVKRNIIEAVKTLHRPKLDQDTVITIAKEQLKENLDLIKRVGNG